MTNGVVQVAPDSTGAKIDTSELTVGANTVERQRVVLASDGTAAGLADVTNTQPASTAYGLPVRVVGDTSVVLSAATLAATGVLGTWDTTGYSSFNVQATGTFTATLIFETSNDNTNWVQGWFNTAASGVTNGVTANIQFATAGHGPIKARYLRLRCSSFTSSASGAFTVILRTVSFPVERVEVGSIQSVSTAISVTPTTAPTTATGTTAFVKSAATTNATSVKASAGNLLSLALTNCGAAARYIKFYNKASAPTVGTDTPVCLFSLPPGWSTMIDGNTWGFPRFSTGIAYAITGANGDADTTAITANEVSGWIVYA